ncbi:hypothetical protein [Nitrosomonas sp.]|uniref:hypothetical protein n=1 Tax=Nitrosomonas sp. TaxID=42353 RepID=UPI0037C60DD5
MNQGKCGATKTPAATDYFANAIQHTEIDDLSNFLERKDGVESILKNLNHQELVIYILWLSGEDLRKYFSPEVF